MENNKSVTAVEWLLNQIETKNGTEFSSYYSEFIEQAKEMEKSQIKDAVNYGCSDWGSFKDVEQYYNKTYGK